MCYRVIRDAKRRNNGGHRPRAEDDQCPAYYGVDFKDESGKLTCKFTVHEGTKTSSRKSAPADRRSSRVALFPRAPDLVPRPVARFEVSTGGGGHSRGNVLKHPTAVAVYRRDLGVHVFPTPSFDPRSEHLERKNRIAGGATAASGPVLDVRNPSRA